MASQDLAGRAPRSDRRAGGMARPVRSAFHRRSIPAFVITYEELWVYLYLAFRDGEAPEDMAARFASWKAEYPMGMPKETVLTPEVAAAFLKAAQG